MRPRGSNPYGEGITDMIEFEKWAPMPGFPGYVIGDQGHAARVLPDGRRERIAPIVQGGRLYYRMRFRKHRCLLLAERAVAEAFIQSSPVGYGIRLLSASA